jgi:endonuclease/exonuclease/phosphatase family metal-dependent hydrolase
MRRVLCVLALVACTLPLHYVDAGARAAGPRRVDSPPGQVKVVTINAKQNRILGLKRFTALFELGRALRARPIAFDGGFDQGIAPPEVVILGEMRPSNVEIFERLLKQRYGLKYEIVGPTDSAATIVINTERISLDGEVVVWSDVCTDADHPTDGRSSRNYEFARLTANDTGSPFVVAGMHAAKNYTTTGMNDCFIRNIQELRKQLENETAPVIIGGDFNRRMGTTQRECDLNEESEPQRWWSMLATPEDGGRPYEDAVFVWHRAHNVTMEREWTHEAGTKSEACTGTFTNRRSRIDYLFSAGTGIAEAHADHPGWAGPRPGTRNKTNYKYSDHRWVWGRFVIEGPPQPARPTSAPQRGGAIELTWQPVEGAGGYVVYRSLPGRSYRILERIASDAATTTVVDDATAHGVVYRYAVAAVSTEGGQGQESLPTFERADSRGPRVIAVKPAVNATGVPVDSDVEIYLDENVVGSSVTPNTIKVYAGGGRARGRVVVFSNRHIVFEPARLVKGTSYRVVVRDLQDKLGNVGPRKQWSFTTVAPPPRDRHRRR